MSDEEFDVPQGEEEESQADDPHLLAASYALDAITDAERVIFEAHLTNCPDCRREVAECAEISVRLSEGLEVEPPPALREQLLAMIATAPQDAAPARGLAAPIDELADRRAARHRPADRVSRWWLAAVAAGIIAIGAVAVTQWPGDAQDPSTVVAVQKILDSSDAIRSTASVDGASVTVVTSYALDRAALLTEGMPGPPEGQDYQMWFVSADGAAVSAGLMPREGGEVLLAGEPGDAVAVGITLEPAGGSDQPTSEPLVAIPLKG
ncbi:MAG: anti-sigma factor [Ornithinimicrobium sp.]|uniref:anti-sigma factor n=1 Tax=Ornithinimicrobium sp. TaxID=1977084 RepID=UPI0026DF102E|nr:anti-sigma factor [Ornithinimicrobium sp.]MDO5739525.1 anti-sigma factor [Ornithinimicrobium sp.]